MSKITIQNLQKKDKKIRVEGMAAQSTDLLPTKKIRKSLSKNKQHFGTY
jgi:hypothetical protein